MKRKLGKKIRISEDKQNFEAFSCECYTYPCNYHCDIHEETGARLSEILYGYWRDEYYSPIPC